MPIVYPGQSNIIPLTAFTTGPSDPTWKWEVKDVIDNVSIDHATTLGATGDNGWTVDVSGDTNVVVTPPVGFAMDPDTDRYYAFINRAT